jgi:small-conductance mechanosensitive channel
VSVAALLVVAVQLPTAEEIPGLSELLERISFGTVTLALFVLLVAFALARFLIFALDALGTRAPRARFFFKILAPLARLIVWGAALAFILFALLAPSPAAMLTVLAPVGIAIGLGAQTLVKDLIGGFVILTDRPYQLGDRVKIGDAYGEIDYIGLRSTKLTTADDTRVTIPNSVVLSGLAWNANSGNPDCLVVTDLFLPHDCDPQEATQVASEAAYSSPYVLLTKPVAIRLEDRFQDGPYTHMRVKAYVYDHRWEKAFQTDVTVRAKAELLKRGMLGSWSRH